MFWRFNIAAASSGIFALHLRHALSSVFEKHGFLFLEDRRFSLTRYRNMGYVSYIK